MDASLIQPVGGEVLPGCFVGALSFSALQVSMANPRTWPIFSAARRSFVRPQLLLNVVEVALKLQTSATSAGGFLRRDSAEPRAYLLKSCFVARNFHKDCRFY